jgi:succinoglycan biosynthesis transport protein ExoP
MTLQQFLLILRARWVVALLTLLVTVLVTVGVSIILPKQYTANAAVVVDVRSPDPVTGMMLQGMIAPGYMATQIDIINSDRVAQRVVKLLRMEESAAIRQQWQDETEGKGQLLNWLAALLQKNLEVKPARESNVINISYTGADPDFAATVSNAFAQSYLDVNLELKLAPARQYASFFEEQSKTARARLDQALTALSSYQQANGLVSADERLDYETAKLNETSSQLTMIQAQTTDSQSKRQNTKADTVAEVMQSPLINGLKADIARLEGKLQEGNVMLGKNHPQTLRTESELASLRAQLQTEIRKITASINTTYQVGKQREEQLKKAIAAQKTRVLELNQQRDELRVLRNDIDIAQRAFETISQRAAQTNIESQNSQTNIAVLNSASPPTDPSRPRVFLNVLVSVFLGTLLGVGLALMLELANRKVRSADDLVESLDLPVLGTIASAGRSLKRSGGSNKSNGPLATSGARA